MIDKELINKTNELKTLMNKHLLDAKEGLKNLPEGKTKDQLTSLLNQAAKGKVSAHDASIKLKEILNHAS